MPPRYALPRNIAVSGGLIVQAKSVSVCPASRYRMMHAATRNGMMIAPTTRVYGRMRSVMRPLGRVSRRRRLRRRPPPRSASAPASPRRRAPSRGRRHTSRSTKVWWKRERRRVVQAAALPERSGCSQQAARPRHIAGERGDRHQSLERIRDPLDVTEPRRRSRGTARSPPAASGHRRAAGAPTRGGAARWSRPARRPVRGRARGSPRNGRGTLHVLPQQRDAAEHDERHRLAPEVPARSEQTEARLHGLVGPRGIRLLRGQQSERERDQGERLAARVVLRGGTARRSR